MADDATIDDEEEEDNYPPPAYPAKFGNWPGEIIFTHLLKSYDKENLFCQVRRPKYIDDPDQSKYTSWFWLEMFPDEPDEKDWPVRLELQAENDLIRTFDICELTFNDFYKNGATVRVYSTYDEDLNEGEYEYNIFLQAVTPGDDNSGLIRDIEKIWDEYKPNRQAQFEAEQAAIPG